MFFDIDVSNGVPVFEQVARQIKYAIAEGVFEPGQLIPSVRDMARELAINPNTVARAYRDLQSEEVIELVRGTGLAVSRGAKATCRDSRSKLIRERVRVALQEALNSQLSVDEVMKIVEAELKKLSGNKT
jgi:GntR family transcriptional regulator